MFTIHYKKMYQTHNNEPIEHARGFLIKDRTGLLAFNNFEDAVDFLTKDRNHQPVEGTDNQFVSEPKFLSGGCERFYIVYEIKEIDD